MPTMSRRIRCMSVAFLLLLASFGLCLAAAGPVAPDGPPTRGENLVPNGDFEAGKNTPDGWQTLDGLSTFLVTGSPPALGKVI